MLRCPTGTLISQFYTSGILRFVDNSGFALLSALNETFTLPPPQLSESSVIASLGDTAAMVTGPASRLPYKIKTFTGIIFGKIRKPRNCKIINPLIILSNTTCVNSVITTQKQK